MNEQNTDRYELNQLIAQAKFSLIAPVITGTYNDDSAIAYFRRISKEEIRWPDGTEKSFSGQTLKYRMYRYRKCGFEALVPKGLFLFFF